MTGASLQRFTIASLVFHIFLFAAAFLAARHSSDIVIPPPYIVNLVGSEPEAQSESSAKVVAQAPEKSETKKESEAVQKPKTLTKNEEQRISEQIEALKAKRKIKDRANLRKIVLSSKASINVGNKLSSQPIRGKGEGSIMGAITAEYGVKINNLIHQYWSLPPNISNKNLMATISIRIMKNGSVQIIGFEKKSGNSLFDHAALTAINKSIPLPPPPPNVEEFEVTFYP